MLRKSQNFPGNPPSGASSPKSDWESDELLRTFEPLRTKWSPLKILICVIGALCVLVVLIVFFRSGGKSERLVPVEPSEKPEAPEGKTKVDPKAYLAPIEPDDRCECRRCKEWREYRRKPWLKPRKDNYVKGCESHLMVWHQVTSKDKKKNGYVLPGPGNRFQHPGVVCDICQKDFKKIARKLWEEKKEVLHSWTCYKCVWEDPDRYVKYRDSKTGKMTKRHAINHGVDVCGVCATKCPDQIRTFTEMGPEGKLVHPGHPGDHIHVHVDKQSLIKEMRERVKEEL